MPIRPLLVALTLALASLALVSCSGENDASSTTAAAARTETATSSFEQIPDLVESVQPSIVAVLVTTPSGAGEGSGVVWSEGGRIVTNRHVVEGATRVRVQLATGERVPAQVLATDALTDLAVLEIEREDLVPAKFAETLPRVGELAIALGNPLGFEQTATQGIVSGLGRALPGGGPFGALVNLVQTDAAISPGNSGGALVNADGEVIGINVAYVPPSGGAVALGFAIPSPTVREVVEELLTEGRATHAYLGIQVAAVTPGVADQLGVEGGALVAGVEPGSPAATAGLRRSDVIVAVEDTRIDAVEELLGALRRREPGDQIAVQYVRDGLEQKTIVTLATRPEP